MTTVVKVNRKAGNFTLYIGRAWAGLPASKWANPFHITENHPRGSALERYEYYVRSRPDLMAALHEIDDQILGCWCRPALCHGDILIKLREEQLNAQQK
jgi:hypothetical protein